MGVDFYPCAKCGEVFADSGPFGECGHCGTMFCIDCIKCVHEPETEDDEPSCAICRHEIVTDAGLVELLLNYTGMTREEAEKRYRLWRAGY